MKHILLTIVLFSFLTGCTNQNSNEKSEQPDISLNAGFGVVTGSGDFGSMGPKESKILSIRITNTGDAPLVGPPSIDNSNFSIIYQVGCASISPGKRCDLKISFSGAGKAFQSYSGNLNLDSAFLALSATVVDPNPSQTSSVTYSSTPLDFGTITDKQSSIKTLVVTNSGTTTIQNQVVTLGPLYSILSDNCSNKNILPNKTCQVRISLNGMGKSGAINETLGFAGQNLLVIGQVVSSSGSSSLGSPNVQLLIDNTVATNADFGTMSGNQSKQIIVVAKNNGTKASDASISQLLANANFSIAFNQCNNRGLAPGASCQIRLIFSAAGKNGSYTDTLTYAGLSLLVSASAQPLVSYSATYSVYGTCSALACQGTGVQSRTLAVCNLLENGVIVGPADPSNCSQFATQADLEQSCSSPAGQATESITGGSETRSCLAGQTFAQGSFVSVNCSEAGFTQQGNSCLAQSISLPRITLAYPGSSVILKEKGSAAQVLVAMPSNAGSNPSIDTLDYRAFILGNKVFYIKKRPTVDGANLYSVNLDGSGETQVTNIIPTAYCSDYFFLPFPPFNQIPTDKPSCEASFGDWIITTSISLKAGNTSHVFFESANDGEPSSLKSIDQNGLIQTIGSFGSYTTVEHEGSVYLSYINSSNEFLVLKSNSNGLFDEVADFGSYSGTSGAGITLKINNSSIIALAAESNFNQPSNAYFGHLNLTNNEISTGVINPVLSGGGGFSITGYTLLGESQNKLIIIETFVSFGGVSQSSNEVRSIDLTNFISSSIASFTESGFQNSFAQYISGDLLYYFSSNSNAYVYRFGSINVVTGQTTIIDEVSGSSRTLSLALGNDYFAFDLYENSNPSAGLFKFVYKDSSVINRGFSGGYSGGYLPSNFAEIYGRLYGAEYPVFLQNGNFYFWNSSTNSIDPF
jgi:hypothetical protein